MAESKRRSTVYRYVMEKAMLLFLVFDAEGRVMEANHSAKALLGNDVIGRPAGRIFIDFEGSLDINQLADRNASSQRLNIAIENTIPETFYFDFSRENDRIIAMGQVDQLELEVMQRNLVEINTQLSNTTRMLQKANAELAGLNDLKNQFIGMAAHDMRSPIGQIMACSELLMADRGETQKKDELDFLNIIQTSSQFVLRLIDEFLDLSVIESGHLYLDIRSTNLVDLIQRNIHLNRLLAEKEKISLSFEYEETIPIAAVDPGKIEQVLNNLISNALKFSEPKSSVQVRLFKSNEDLVVSVRDQGPGVPRSEIANIFAPYAKTRTRDKNGAKSAGLGLAIAHKIIEGHQGRIWVESEPNRGATFYFSLPIIHKG